MKLNMARSGRSDKDKDPVMFVMLSDDSVERFGTALATNPPFIVFIPSRAMLSDAEILIMPVNEGQADAKDVAWAASVITDVPFVEHSVGHKILLTHCWRWPFSLMDVDDVGAEVVVVVAEAAETAETDKEAKKVHNAIADPGK